MNAALMGLIPTNLFDQSFPFEAVITDVMIGRGVRVKSVTPWTFQTDASNNQRIISANNVAYMAFVSSEAGFWNAGTVARFSIAGKDQINAGIEQLTGKMILFDNLICLDADDLVTVRPFQCIGWKMDIEGATNVVPGGPAPGSDIVLSLDGVDLDASNSLTDILGNFFSQTDTSAVLDANAVAANFSVTLPKTIGFSFDVDYGFSGVGDYTLSASDGGATWIVEFLYAGVGNVPSAVIGITSNVAFVNVAVSAAASPDSITDVKFGGFSGSPSAGFPVASSGSTNFGYPVGSGSLVVSAIGSNVTDIWISVVDGDGAPISQAQQYTGAGDYTFSGFVVLPGFSGFVFMQKVPGGKLVTVVNQSGGAINVQSSSSAVLPGNGNTPLLVAPAGVVQNLSGVSLTFTFLTDLIPTLDPDEVPNPDILADTAIHTLNASIVNLNYIKLT